MHLQVNFKLHVPVGSEPRGATVIVIMEFGDSDSESFKLPVPVTNCFSFKFFLKKYQRVQTC
jgi:hypothetical protein